MIAFDVEFEKRTMDRAFKTMIATTPKNVERAKRDALKRGKTVFTGKEGATSVYNIKKKDLSRFTKITSNGIDVESRRLTVGTSTHFSITPREYSSQKGIPVAKRKKATMTIKKGNKESMKHAFIANPAKVGNTMLFTHDTAKGGVHSKREEGEDIINAFRTLSAAQMASNEEIVTKVVDEMEKKFDDRLEHYMERSIK